MPPWLVRRCLLPLHERLLGRGTLARLREWEATQWWTGDRLRELQEKKLRALLSRAISWSDFHRRRLRDAGIDPARTRLSDLPRLPTLDKSQIAAHFDALVNPAMRSRLTMATTGGSTGDPLRFMIDRARQAADQAARARSRRWFGIEPGERELYLWGSPIENTATDRLKTLRDRLTNQRLLNAFHMTPKRMKRYLAVIERFDPVHLFGYPSSLAALARFARDHHHVPRGRSLHAVFTTGETLQPKDRDDLESAFQTTVADGYGAREAGFVAHQCPAGAYHVSMESLIVEVLREDGRATSPGELGEVVVTHLEAFGMPFIRYRTGDLARRADHPCPCGRGLETLSAIEGRRTDLLRRADGGLAHGLSVIYVLREEPGVAQFRVHQNTGKDLDVQIVPRGPLDPAAFRRIESRLRGQLGDVVIRLSLRDEINVDPSGKRRCVSSEAV